MMKDEPSTSAQTSPNALQEPRENLLDSIKKAAFIVGTALVCFIAARNSITWHVQQFWGASGDFWQSQWVKIHALCGGNDFMVGVVGTYVVTHFVYWFFNALLMIPDCTGRPKFLFQYRVQEGVNDPVDPLRLRKAIKGVLINQIFVSGPTILVMFKLMQLRGCEFGTELPTFHYVLGQLILMVFIEEFGFYYSHRLLHHGRFYKHVHKIHHEWTAPIGLVSIYCHPLEHLMSNLIPALFGTLVVRAHIATVWLWMTIVILSTTVSHSGYHLPLLPSPEAHDFHHLKFNQNFGVLGVLDRLHGTDAQFRASTQYKRHIMLLSLQPIKEFFPDEKPKKKCE